MNSMIAFKMNLIVAGFLSLFLLGISSQAQTQERKTKQTVAMSQKVYEKLIEIQELVEAKNYANAQRLIDDVSRVTGKKSKLSDYERAQIYNLEGYSYYLQERYADAIRSYEKVLAQPELPEALVLSTLKTMAQLQFTQEDYKGALVTINRLMQAVAEPSADIYMLKGQALFQMERYNDALNPIKTAIDLYRDQGRPPKENWLLLLRVIYFERNDYANMLNVVKELIVYYPKDTYILTLAGIYSEQGDTKKQLVLTEVLYEKGMLNSAANVTNLANLYLMHGLPYKAAVLLQTEMDKKVVVSNERNLRLLSQSWYQAREDQKAIPPLKVAADMSEDGELYVRLAQSHINLEQWSEAAAAIQKGLKLGGLKRDDQANIMLGMALFNQKRLTEARRAFERANRDNRSKRTAGQWINYVDSEIRRAELMAQDAPEFKKRQRDALEDALSTR
ncbi:MAG: tetratricopeptide repeat protein [Proteobacteria bacterium]|nr:tetratricopeptide repeat protein [Pseudomonadota bacterium]